MRKVAAKGYLFNHYLFNLIALWQEATANFDLQYQIGEQKSFEGFIENWKPEAVSLYSKKKLLLPLPLSLKMGP